MDVGTGFYVEKTPAAAQDFYQRKVEELGKNLGDLEKIVQGKQGNLNTVEDGEYHTYCNMDSLGGRRLIGSSFETEGYAGE